MKFWQGGQYVDPAMVRVWDGSAFVEPKLYIWENSQFNQIWPLFQLLDDFNRADTGQNAGLGSDWWNFCSWSQVEFPRINNNQARGSGGTGSSNVTNGSVRKEPVPAGVNDYFLEITPNTLPANTTYTMVGLILRANDTSDHYPSANAGPEAVFIGLTSNFVNIYRAPTGISTGPTQVVAAYNVSPTLTSGGVLRVELRGDFVAVYYSGRLICSGMIAGMGSGRKPGIYFNNDGIYVDNFKAGVLTDPFVMPTQRMVKSGDSASTQNPIQSWTPDATNPAVIVGHKLTVLGSGPAKAFARVEIKSRTTTNPGREFSLWHNSTLLGSFIAPISTNGIYDLGPYPITVAPGDTVYMSGGTANVGGGTMAGTTSYVEVTPP
ncbi:hypothetical protein SEA_LITTLEFELLA_31 [Gordonia phage LittleFella]|nr:hypothetical protein SEA_LITTLEFELLA_31 [Gordonia phage LittleFella]